MAVFINRCICTDRKFCDLVDEARRCGQGFDALSEATGAGRHCGLCRPYLRRALETGQTEFTSILTEDPAPQQR